MEKFDTIGLIGRSPTPPVVETLNRVIRFLAAKGRQVVIDESIAGYVHDQSWPVASRDTLGEQCDLAIVVGGDGSMLGAARAMAKHQVPVLGVNRGRLGFLTDILPEQVERQIDEVLEGHFVMENRFLLQSMAVRDGNPIAGGDALNDVVLHTGKASKMIEFELFIDGQFVYSQRSDGLILSTPTGSTAYSLSGGGPIMHPKLDAMVLVPMFPHALGSRPIVIDGNSEIKIIVVGNESMYPCLTCDGQQQVCLAAGDVVYVHKNPHKLKLIHPLDHNYYAVCRSKLGWGSRLEG